MKPELAVFDNPNVPNSNSCSIPPKTGLYLIYGFDKGLNKNIFIQVYYRTDTQMFYMDHSCKKENGLENFWKIHPSHWILLQELGLESFEDK